MTANDEAPDTDQLRIKDLIPLSQAAVISGLSMSHLSLLIRKGELWWIKIGRDWLTTEKAVRDYLSKGMKPGPKPRKASK